MDITSFINEGKDKIVDMIKKVTFIENFLSADLDSKLSSILSTSELPFDDIASLLENAMNRASETTNLDSLIVGPMNEMINETKMSLPDSELSDIANTTEMELILTSYEDPVNHCYKMCDPQFPELTKSYSQFFTNFNSFRIEFSQTKEKIEPVLDGVPGNVSSLSYSLFSGLLKSMGKTVS